jgi:hypothetical protein
MCGVTRHAQDRCWRSKYVTTYRNSMNNKNSDGGEIPPPQYCSEEEIPLFNQPRNPPNPDSADPIGPHDNLGWQPQPPGSAPT